MKTISILTSILIFLQVCNGQKKDVASKPSNKVDFSNNIDSVIMSEIAFFTVNGKSKLNTDTLPNPNLSEIPIKRITDSSAYFEKGNLYTGEIRVGIYLDKSRIKEIMFLHYKLGLILPDSAFSGLHAPKFSQVGKSIGDSVLINIRVLRSEDKRRVYIYMLNNEGKNRYEVTWVIQDSEYYKRVLNYIKPPDGIR